MKIEFDWLTDVQNDIFLPFFRQLNFSVQEMRELTDIYL